MSNVKEQKFKRLKRLNLSGSIFGFIIVSLMAVITLAVMIGGFFYYMVESKLGYEHQRLRNMAELYEASGFGEKTDIYRLLDDSVYIIIDADNNILKEHGENTCNLEDEKKIEIEGLTFKTDDEEERIIPSVESGFFADKEADFIFVNPRGEVNIDVSRLVKAVRNDGESLENSEQHVGLPFWLPMELSDGTRLVGKAFININLRDVLILCILAIAIAVMLFIIFIMLIANAIKVRKNRKKMTEIFFMDDVTGKHNWMWFLTTAEQQLKKKKNAGVKFAVLDIVFVNYRNFCVCHSVADGEKMLCRVNDVIESRLAKNELIAHYASANFVALMRYTDRDKLEERIKSIIDELSRIDDDHKFSFHVGIYRIKESLGENGKKIKRKDVDIDRDYNNACTARATLSDNDDSAIAFFDEKMVEEQKWIDTVVEKQEKAIIDEEFVVYYQPKYDPRTDELRGAEALIRWMSPESGMIPPGRFIPIFEKNGFITEIDHYMLRHVALDQKKWLDKGYKCVPVSVNVSRAHFIESDLAEQIRDIVDEAGAPHNLIEIELTESAFFDDKNAMIRTIKKLKEYGFAVSMDDFGAGYSSLNSLKEMPLDVLKLDADFFRNDEGDGRGQIVVAEAIKLAKNLNMRTVAEGVEIKEQVEFLADQGCDMIQGYYYAKPMPGEEYEGKMNV